MSDGNVPKTKEFPLADVIGAVTGYLLGPISGIYEISQFMSGEPIWTHQLPRICREICSVVLTQHPQLSPIIIEAPMVTCDNWQEMLAGWRQRFGETLPLHPMSLHEHERIDPLSEAAEKIHPDFIFTVGS